MKSRPLVIRSLHVRTQNLAFGPEILQLHRKFLKLEGQMAQSIGTSVTNATEAVFRNSEELKKVFEDMLSELRGDRAFTSPPYQVLSTWIITAGPCLDKIARDVKRLQGVESDARRLQTHKNLAANLSRMRDKTEKTRVRLDHIRTKHPVL